MRSRVSPPPAEHSAPNLWADAADRSSIEALGIGRDATSRMIWLIREPLPRTGPLAR